MKRETILEYSVFPGNVIHIAMLKLVNFFFKTKNQSREISVVDGIKVLSKQEKDFLETNFCEVPKVRLVKLYYIPSYDFQRDVALEKEFNCFLDKLLFKISSVTADKVGHFSLELSEKISFHNLDIVPNPESAARLYDIL